MMAHICSLSSLSSSAVVTRRPVSTPSVRSICAVVRPLRDPHTYNPSGYIDTEVTSNALTYTAVDKCVSRRIYLQISWSDALLMWNSSQGFWQVDSLSWSLGGQKKERSGNTTILDTGTTLLLVSDDVVEELYGASGIMHKFSDPWN